MGTFKESQTPAVMERATSHAAGTDEWWTALSFEDGDLALEPDPVLATAEDPGALELRLYSF